MQFVKTCLSWLPVNRMNSVRMLIWLKWKWLPWLLSWRENSLYFSSFFSFLSSFRFFFFSCLFVGYPYVWSLLSIENFYVIIDIWLFWNWCNCMLLHEMKYMDQMSENGEAFVNRIMLNRNVLLLIGIFWRIIFFFFLYVWEWSSENDMLILIIYSWNWTYC